jgi:general secretion pathway protein F
MRRPPVCATPFEKARAAGGRLKQRDAAMLFRGLAMLLRIGLPVDRSLDIMVQLARDAGAGMVIGDVLTRVRGGAALAEAMEARGQDFPRFAIAMVRAGEAAGAVAVVMARLAEFTARSDALKTTVVSAMFYPLLMLVVALELASLLVTGARLPVSSPLLSGVDLAAASWWLAPLAVVVVLALRARHRTDPLFRLGVDCRLLAVPWLGRLIAHGEVARSLKGLATLLANGVPLLAALALLGETIGNAAIAAAFTRAGDAVRQGRGFADSLSADPWFPMDAARLLAVGEKTGCLAETAAQAANGLLHDNPFGP